MLWTPGLVSGVVVLLPDVVLVVRIVFVLVSLLWVVLCHVVGGMGISWFVVWGLFGCGCGLGVGWEAGGPAGKEGLGVGGWVIVGGDGACEGGVVLDVGGAVIVEVGGGEGDGVFSRRTCPWRMLRFCTGAVDGSFGQVRGQIGIEVADFSFDLVARMGLCTLPFLPF